MRRNVLLGLIVGVVWQPAGAEQLRILPILNQHDLKPALPKSDEPAFRAGAKTNRWVTTSQTHHDGTASPALPRSRCNGMAVDVAGKRHCLKPGSGDVFRDCANCPDMVVVPPGSFTMGTSKSKRERPRRRVKIATPFAIGRFQVTRAQFEIFVKATGHDVENTCWTYKKGGWQELFGRSFRNPGFAQDHSHPAVCVNWHDAAAYAVWLSKMTGERYRLPSEAEWEYVTRAGTTTPFWWGASISTDQANYNGSAVRGDGTNVKYRRGTVKVHTFKPNPWGLYQVHGNVWEWVGGDCWNETYKGGPTDGSPWITGDCRNRVLRGGSWASPPRFLRSAARNWDRAGHRNYVIGFRVARTLVRQSWWH